MPTYEFGCIECDYTKEVNRPMANASDSEVCEKCGYAMVKVYNSFGIQFKGTGFYKTDNAK
jgi:putative FmdB family regulatory protein